MAALELPANAEDTRDTACEDAREDDAGNASCLLDEAVDGGSAVESASGEIAEDCDSASDEEICEKSSAFDAGKDDPLSIWVVTLAITWAVSGTRGGA